MRYVLLQNSWVVIIPTSKATVLFPDSSLKRWKLRSKHWRLLQVCQLRNRRSWVLLIVFVHGRLHRPARTFTARLYLVALSCGMQLLNWWPSVWKVVKHWAMHCVKVTTSSNRTGRKHGKKQSIIQKWFLLWKAVVLWSMIFLPNRFFRQMRSLTVSIKRASCWKRSMRQELISIMQKCNWATRKIFRIWKMHTLSLNVTCLISWVLMSMRGVVTTL